VDLEPGLTFVNLEQARNLVESARRADLPVYVITTAGHNGREAFFDAVRGTLPLDPPIQSARSWEALSDSLWEGIWLLESSAIVIVWPDAFEFRQASADEYEMAILTLRQVVESLADSTAAAGRPKAVSVLVGMTQAQ
jgi:hypothetical protein